MIKITVCLVDSVDLHILTRTVAPSHLSSNLAQRESSYCFPPEGLIQIYMTIGLIQIYGISCSFSYNFSSV